MLACSRAVHAAAALLSRYDFCRWSARHRGADRDARGAVRLAGQAVVPVFFIVYRSSELRGLPGVMARSVDVPPMIAVIAAADRAGTAGVVGALLAIPLSAG